MEGPMGGASWRGERVVGHQRLVGEGLIMIWKTRRFHRCRFHRRCHQCVGTGVFGNFIQNIALPTVLSYLRRRKMCLKYALPTVLSSLSLKFSDKYSQ